MSGTCNVLEFSAVRRKELWCSNGCMYNLNASTIRCARNKQFVVREKEGITVVVVVVVCVTNIGGASRCQDVHGRSFLLVDFCCTHNYC